MVLFELLCQVAIFVLSMIVLAKSSDIVVDGTEKFARATRIGSLTAGFLLLSIVSNLPEISVAFSAITAGTPEISIGNLLGSNIADLALVIGITAIIAPIAIVKKSFRKLIVILLLSSLIPLVLLGLSEMGMIVGVALIAAFVIFAVYSVKEKINLDLAKETPAEVFGKVLSPLRSYKHDILIGLGILLLIISSRFVVWSATTIAGIVGISESILGATVVSLGTIIPELSVSINGIRKKYYSLILGNGIGGCLTKVTLILGILLLFSPDRMSMGSSMVLMSFLILSTVMVAAFMLTGKKIDRKEGVALILLYVVFLLFTLGFQMTVIDLFS